MPFAGRQVESNEVHVLAQALHLHAIQRAQCHFQASQSWHTRNGRFGTTLCLPLAGKHGLHLVEAKNRQSIHEEAGRDTITPSLYSLP